MTDRSPDPGFEYARLCELQSDVSNLREVIHALHNYLSRPPSSADTGGATNGWTPQLFAVEMRNVNEIAVEAVRKFNETQKLLPYVGGQFNTSVNLNQAMSENKSFVTGTSSPEEEKRLKDAQRIRQAAELPWASRAEHFDRLARCVETRDYSIAGVPSLLLNAGSIASPQNRGVPVESRLTKPLYHPEVQAYLEHQTKEATEKIGYACKHDPLRRDSDPYPFINVFKGTLSSGSSGTQNSSSLPPPAATSAAGGALDERTSIIRGVTLVVNGVFVAVVSFGAGGVVSNVFILGIDEVSYVPRSNGQVRVQSESMVFRELSSYALIAASFFEKLHPATALSDFIIWLCSYEKLFVEPCAQCGLFLVAHQELIPPICRDFLTLRPYHRCCLARIAPVHLTPNPVQTKTTSSAQPPPAATAGAGSDTVNTSADMMQ